mgnify:CR=1 FL=1
MAARQCNVTFKNETDNSLTFVKKSNEHGEFMSTPPVTIPPKNSGSWEHGSSGIMTGSVGIIEYVDEKKRIYHLHFANPFVGTTWQECFVSPNDGGVELTGEASPSSNGNAKFTFTVKKK